MAGGGHEQPHANAFLLKARGEYLLLDSGYINFDERSLVAAPDNHNLILVDGAGPSASSLSTDVGTDTFLSEYEVTAAYKTVVSSTTYAGASFVRRLVLLPDDVLVVHDSVSSNAPHSYEWLLHGNALDPDFTLREDGATWVRTAASVDATVTSTAGAPECAAGQDIHSFDHGNKLEHRVLRCALDAEDVDFLAVMRVGPAAGSEPLPPAVVEASGALQFESEGLVTWVGVRTVSGVADTPCGPVASEPGLLLVRCDSGGAPESHHWETP